ncbi:MAG TPA: hypothetical protein ACFYD4_13600 [Candidatus Wunengus sp. YC61]|uniref:hypothetical protein n=1 Tax=Candidatus Wunengus sp. YC61 TaxID=3367698 RepID=UPI00402A4000
MDDDTQGLPVEDTGQGDEPGPEPEGEPQETGDDGAQGEREPETVAQPEPLVATPTPLTQEQLLQQAEERAFQRTASWMGRREQTNLDNIMRNVVQAIDSRLSKFSPTAPLPQVDKGYDPDAFVENPEPMLRSLVPKIMSEVVSRQAETEKRYNVELVRQAGLLMTSDPAFQGVEG